MLGTRSLQNVLGEARIDKIRSKLKNDSFLSRGIFLSKSFLFSTLLYGLVPITNVRALVLSVSAISWSFFFFKAQLSHRASLLTLTTAIVIFRKTLFHFNFRAGGTCLKRMVNPDSAKHVGTVRASRKLKW